MTEELSQLSKWHFVWSQLTSRTASSVVFRVLTVTGMATTPVTVDTSDDVRVEIMRRNCHSVALINLLCLIVSAQLTN